VSSCHSFTWEILPLYIPLSRHCTLSLHLSLLLQPNSMPSLAQTNFTKPNAKAWGGNSDIPDIPHVHPLPPPWRPSDIPHMHPGPRPRRSISKYCVIHTPARKAFLFFILLPVLPIQHIYISQYNLGHPYHPFEASRFLG
jgi:hypothetical protein